MKTAAWLVKDDNYSPTFCEKKKKKKKEKFNSSCYVHKMSVSMSGVQLIPSAGI